MSALPHDLHCTPRSVGQHDDHDDHGGLQRDVPALLGRRRALQWLGGVSLAGLVAACGSGDDQPAGSAAASTSSTGASAVDDGSDSTAPTAASAGTEIPDETAGPFPSDGSNGPNILAEDGVVRSDIRSSIGSFSGTADGVPMTLQLTVVDAATGQPLPGAALYAWHCSADARYSIYEVTDQNYLRGVQVADDAGRVTFTSVFPGCYPGRWPHVHFEVYDSLDVATAADQARKTSQLALPQADCEVVYQDTRYGSSSAHLAAQSLASDMIFADGWSDQLATVAGDPTGGYTASLLVRV